jgi:hypothetical protein
MRKPEKDAKNVQVRSDEPKPTNEIKVWRDPALEARDRWIYDECCKGRPYRTIINWLRSRPERWRFISTVQGIRYVAAQYARRHRLPPPPRRQDK